VVAAVIRRDGRILVTRRHGHAERGGQWEFPGGKIEPGEAEPEALVREIREELDCDVKVGALLARTRYRYPDLEVELAFYAATLAPGAEPRLVGAAAMEWSEPSRLATYDFCEADLPVLPVLAGEDGGGEPGRPR
jgi:8-oxo-dGTP diphosphatase